MKYKGSVKRRGKLSVCLGVMHASPDRSSQYIRSGLQPTMCLCPMENRRSLGSRREGIAIRWVMCIRALSCSTQPGLFSSWKEDARFSVDVERPVSWKFVT